MARHADGRNSIKHGSTRVAGLARWLDKKPNDKRYDTLLLELKSEGEWQRVQGWSTHEVSPLLADTIEALCQEQCNDLGAYCSFRCVWWASEGDTYWTSRDLRYHPEMDGMQVEQVFSGEHANALIQTQRHLEKQHGAYMMGMTSAMEALKMSNADLREVASGALSDNQELRARNRELEAENARLTQLAEQATETAEDLQSKLEAYEKKSNVVNIATQAVLKGVGLPVGETTG